MENEQQPNEPMWSQVTPDVQKIRIGVVQEKEKLLIDLMQRQIETIGKFLLLVNAGGAGAVLAAFASKQDLPLHGPLASYVLGIVILGFALAASYGLYVAALNATQTAFDQHIRDQLGWVAMLEAMLPRNWTSKIKKTLRTITGPLYWLSFACFVAGSAIGGLKLLC